MKSKIFKRIAAFVLAAITAFSFIPGTTAFASGEAGNITFDYCYDSNGNMILYNGETDVDGYLAGGTGHPKPRMFVDGETAYMQENCKLGLSDNCVIYGHHMQDGSMFADLCKYESEDLYKEHKTIHFDTLAGFGEYEIVCVFKTAAYSADGFKYYHFVDAADAPEFNSFQSA